MIGIGGIPGSGSFTVHPLPAALTRHHHSSQATTNNKTGIPSHLTHSLTHSLLDPKTGKTTLSTTITAALNARHARENPSPSPPAPVAAFVPMDGFHLTRAQLDAMPDPATAHARRGAEFTFDGEGFLRLVQALREPLPASSSSSSPPQPPSDNAGSGNPPPTTTTTTTTAGPYPPGTILAPAFDHALKDPQPGAIPVLPRHRLVVLEGNYLALDRDPWRAAAQLLDELWFVDVPDLAVARARLAARHVRAGIAATLAEGDRRAVDNDLVNGDEILRLRAARVDEVIVSREDGAWVGT